MKVSVNGSPLELPEAFAITIEESNPIFNDRGSQSLPVTVPCTPTNMELLGFLSRIDSNFSDRVARSRCRVEDGFFGRSGVVNVVSAGRRDGVSFNVGLDNSTVYEKWQKRKLPELSGLPFIVPPHLYDVYDIMLDIYLDCGFAREHPDLAVFPLVVEDKYIEETADRTEQIKVEKHYYELLNNLPNEKYRSWPYTVKRIVNGEVTEIKVPRYYGLTPFVRLWRVVELVFADSGYELEGNPFKEDPELARIVVLNNVADACCGNNINYADLMPEVTVEEFLESLLTRFGLVWQLDQERGVARLRLLRDIVYEAATVDFTVSSTDWPLINYESPKYVKLSAASSLEGAAPVTERFEDFIKGYNLDDIIFGRVVKNWQWRPEDDDFEFDYPEYNDDVDWDPDEGREEWDYDDFYDDYWDDDRDDGRDDYGNRAVLAPARVSAGGGDISADDTKDEKRRLAFEVRTQMWFRLDKENRLVDEASTSFFNWDPQTEGCEAEEHQSVDEWVPVQLAMSSDINGFSGLVPMFLAGARYAKTYISSGVNDDDKGDAQTPLAYLFAFSNCDECPQGTIGRFSPDTAEGKNVTFLQDGSTHTLSLCFQFKNGLFARFWKGYDELLRHASRVVELPVAVDRHVLRGINMLSPVKYGNNRFLVDKMSYTLPASGKVAANVSLRPLFTTGEYDIEVEQGIPNFDPGLRKVRWCHESNNIRRVCMSTESRNRVIALCQAEDSWVMKPSVEGESVVRLLARFMLAEKSGMWWSTDPQNLGTATLGARRQCRYKAVATYHIYREIARTLYTDGVATGTEWLVEEAAVIIKTIEVEYVVTVVGKYVQ